MGIAGAEQSGGTRDAALVRATSGCLCPPMLRGRLETKVQPLPAPLPRRKVLPRHLGRLATSDGFCSWSFSPSLERTLVPGQAWCVPAPSQAHREQPLAQQPRAGGVEPLSRTRSCCPTSACPVPRRPNPSWHPSESSWVLQCLQDAGFCSCLS